MVPGVEFSTGSLGHGLAIGLGIAISFKRDKSRRKVFVLLGDGESAEGSVWEAILNAAKYELDNLIVIIDVNRLQSDNFTEKILLIEPFECKYKSLGWSTKTIDGHNIEQIYLALTQAPFENKKPSCIIANTIKGKGVYFAENNPAFHYWTPKDDKEIDAAIESLKINYKI